LPTSFSKPLFDFCAAQRLQRFRDVPVGALRALAEIAAQDA